MVAVTFTAAETGLSQDVTIEAEHFRQDDPDWLCSPCPGGGHSHSKQACIDSHALAECKAALGVI